MLSKRNLPLVFLLLAVCAVYMNSLGNGFHFDDFHTVTDNPAIRSLGNFGRFFRDTTAFSVLPANQTYRPVVTASLALDYALGHGYVPFWFHLSTLLWFLVLLALLDLFFELLLDQVERSPANRWLALGVAAWFGLHPAMAETVNYVIQRGDLYCTLGTVAALFLYARLPRLRRYGLYLLPFALAMLSKPPAAVFPLLLGLYVFFFEASAGPLAKRWRRSFVAAVPALLVIAALLWLEAAMTPKSYTPTILSAADYRLTQPYVWLRYAGALFLPLHLNVDTDLQAFSSWNGRAIAGLLFLCGLLIAIAVTVRRRRLYPIAFGLLWFILTQLPTSLYPLSEVENDHRMFFSFPGMMLAVAWASYLGYERLAGLGAAGGARRVWLRPVALTLAALCLCGYAYGAHRRNAVWHTEDSLWADDVQKSPRNGRGLMIYGLTRMNAGDLVGASALFAQALRYTPNYPTLEINLGVVHGLLAGQDGPGSAAVAEEHAAEGHFERAVALAPGDDLTHAYYGRWLLGLGRIAEATAQLEAAVRLNPARPMQRDLLLSAYAQAGNAAAAHRLAEATLVRMPDDRLAASVVAGNAPAINLAPAATAADFVNLSLRLSQEGRHEESIAAAQRALALDPNSAEAWNNVAAGDEALHRWDLAIAAAQKAVALRPGFQLAKNNLAWSLQQKAAGH